MAPLPPREQRHLFLRYQGLEYTDEDIADFKEKVKRIYSREIHRVQFVDFQGMPVLMRDGLFTRMGMKHRDDADVVVFTSRAWGRLFDTRGPLVRELILEFLSTLRFGEELLNFDAPGTIQFQLGGARRRLSWRQFILALGLHTEEEMKSPSFARLDEYFGLLTAKILGGLTVIALELPIIDMAKLVRLHISVQFDDTWAWVAIGPERQSLMLWLADPTPIHAPPPPPALARIIPQRMARLEEDVHKIRGVLTEQREIGTADAEAVANLVIGDGVGAPTEDGIGIGVEVAASDIREDEEEFEAEASAGGTMEMAVDPLVTSGIFESTRGDVPDLEGTLYDIAHYMFEVPFDRITEFETTQRQLEIRRDRDDTRGRLRRLESLVERRLGFHHGNNGNGGGNGNRIGGGNGNGNGGGNGNENHNKNDRGARPVVRECTYQDFMKCQPLNFKGTEGVVGLIRTIGTDAAFVMSWRELMKLMAKVFCPRTEIQKMESEL
ncbi:hypothetical protein Tco_1393768 [Tanacetum coccineum]